eukprot:12354273-Prorocentrum_lima.AAC.1
MGGALVVVLHCQGGYRPPWAPPGNREASPHLVRHPAPCGTVDRYQLCSVGYDGSDVHVPNLAALGEGG